LTILFIHVKVYADLSSMPDHPVRVSGFGGEDGDFLDLDMVAQVNAMFGNGRFICVLQTNVPLVLLDSDLSGMAGLPSVDLTTFAGHILHT
jgi:hypothetical protein